MPYLQNGNRGEYTIFVFIKCFMSCRGHQGSLLPRGGYTLLLQTLFHQGLLLRFFFSW